MQIKHQCTVSFPESLLESDFNFAINSVSDFDSTSESASESDFNSVFISLGVCVFFILYLHSSK